MYTVFALLALIATAAGACVDDHPKLVFPQRSGKKENLQLPRLGQQRFLYQFPLHQHKDHLSAILRPLHPL